MVTTEKEKQFLEDFEKLLEKYGINISERNGVKRFFNCKNGEEEIYLEIEDVIGSTVKLVTNVTFTSVTISCII